MISRVISYGRLVPSAVPQPGPIAYQFAHVGHDEPFRSP